jgi:hypothetical protein
MIRALSGVRSDDAYGCMVLLEHQRPSIGHMPATVWCPNTATRRVSVSHNEKGTISTRVCDAHEQGLAGEGRLLETADLGVSSS